MVGKRPRRATAPAKMSKKPVEEKPAKEMTKTIVEYDYKGYDIVLVTSPAKPKGEYWTVRDNKVEHKEESIKLLKKWIDKKIGERPAPAAPQRPPEPAPVIIPKENIKPSKAMWLILRDLGVLPKNNFKILVRRDGFRIVGVVTAKKPELDTELGESRIWAYGNGPDGRIFREPLDRKDPKLKRLESIVLAETQHIIITARRSPDLSDEDENFMWLENPLRVADIKKLIQDVDTLHRVMASEKIVLENAGKLAIYWQTEAQSLGNSVRENEQRISILSKDNNMLIQQVRHFQGLAEAAEAVGIMVRSMLDKIREDARKKGIELEESDIERANNAIDGLVKLRERAGPLSPRPQTSEEAMKLKLELEDANRKIAGLETQLGMKGKPGEKPAAATVG